MAIKIVMTLRLCIVIIRELDFIVHCIEGRTKVMMKSQECKFCSQLEIHHLNLVKTI